jgi:Sds3-like
LNYLLNSIYQEKLNALQEELLAIQQGKHDTTWRLHVFDDNDAKTLFGCPTESHPSLRESMTDLEKARQHVIYQARMIMEYHITCTNEQFQAEISSLEDEYTVSTVADHPTNIFSSELANESNC